MAHAHIPRIAIICILSASTVALLILCTPPALAQVPSFLPAVSYGSGGYLAGSVAVGDVNGDSIIDVVVSNQCVISDTCPNGEAYVCWSSDYCSHGAVGVLLGNGDGSFQPAITYESDGYLSASVALGDLNGDRKLDIVLVNSCGTIPDVDYDCPYGTVDIMFGNGDGTFGVPMSYGLQAWYPFSVALRDLNGDGKLDVAIASICRIHSTCSEGSCTCETGSAEVLLNDGYGFVREDTVYDSGGPWGRSVALGDVNRDGKVDVLVANSGSIGVLLGSGDGSFQPALNFGPGGTIAGWDALAVADVNGDCKLDLLVAAALANYAGTVGVLLGNGDGTFQPAASFGSGGYQGRSVAVADVNGDAKPDLVVANLGGIWPDTRALGVLPGEGNGNFQPALSFDSKGGSSLSVDVGDFNRDGKPDVVVANGGVSVLLNDTSFLCTAAPRIALSAAPTSLWPPNGKMVPVIVSGIITNAGEGCVVKAASYVVKDEYGEVQPSGPVTVTAKGTYSFTVSLQASRRGTDRDGRFYRVTVRASNNAGKKGSQSGTIVVPHNHGQ